MKPPDTYQRRPAGGETALRGALDGTKSITQSTDLLPPDNTREDQDRLREKFTVNAAANEQLVSPTAQAVRRLLETVDVTEAVGTAAVVQTLERATAASWRRRSAMFEWARPRPTDFPGKAKQADLQAIDRRCTAAAAACRNHASLLERGWRDE